MKKRKSKGTLTVRGDRMVFKGEDGQTEIQNLQKMETVCAWEDCAEKTSTINPGKGWIGIIMGFNIDLTKPDTWDLKVDGLLCPKHTEELLNHFKAIWMKKALGDN